MNLSNMAASLAARDAGISSSAAHAEMDAPGWGDRAYQAVCKYMDWDCDWTIEEARCTCYAKGLDVPAEERAWGSVTQKLLRDGQMIRVGFLPAVSSHSSWKPTYRLTP
jgi:hypothetical protein